MAESTDTAVKEKDEISSEAVSVDTDGFGASAMTEEVVLDVKNLQTQFTHAGAPSRLLMALVIT
ncbi:MAG: hypothetical protein CM1200mP39_20530 [Dehalococcoidia bacterium]|nr:MAG: hypothetical protein CM1200mP39_20530 [Dehalococcoidia bacterium]